MDKELTSLQLEMLKALRKHEKASASSSSELFSMNKFYNGSYSDVGKIKFRLALGGLERRGYIERIAPAQNEEFGCYEITDLGLEYLDDIGDEK